MEQNTVTILNGTFGYYDKHGDEVVLPHAYGYEPGDKVRFNCLDEATEGLLRIKTPKTA